MPSVILYGSKNESASEFGEPVSGEEAVSRLRYDAFLQRKTDLPVLLCGGSVRGDEHRSLAESMTTYRCGQQSNREKII